MERGEEAMHAGRSAGAERLVSGAAPEGRHEFGMAEVRTANWAFILAALAREGLLLRSALARRLGLWRTTVSHIVAALPREGRAPGDGALPASESGGRRATPLEMFAGAMANGGAAKGDTAGE